MLSATHYVERVVNENFDELSRPREDLFELQNLATRKEEEKKKKRDFLHWVSLPYFYRFFLERKS